MQLIIFINVCGFIIHNFLFVIRALLFIFFFYFVRAYKYA